MKHRLYIDEVGNSDLNASEDPNHRYLSLTGIVFGIDQVEKDVFPQIEKLKKTYFKSHPDEPVVLHRKDIINKRPPFDSLRDPIIERKFNNDIINLLKNIEYTVFTVVLDKLEFKNKYLVWRYDPYHYCLSILIERYVLWLKRKNLVGDVMTESRGRKEDERLRKAFHYIYLNGTDFIDPETIRNFLTSVQLKIKSKSNNIAGLQFADLIAHPSYKNVLAKKENSPRAPTFGSIIADILEREKYDRNENGKIEGYGIKWLP